tara:strand:+ start:3595 stop:4737 length:1143 start_codon:yes stop_codon:yes gene_type:complete
LETLRYCAKCILPHTRPGISLDKDGICSACRGHLDKINNIDWNSRGRQFDKLIAWAKRKANTYDCIVPVSGGKDSWYQVEKAQKYGLKILCVTWKTPGRTDIGQQNLDGMIAKLGVDHIDFTINPDIERKFMVAAFEKKGATAIPMHMALFSIPMRLAVQSRIPLIIWGENPQLEYGGPKKDRLVTDLNQEWINKYGVTNGTKIEDWVGVNGLTNQDLTGYSLPSAGDLNLFQPKSIFLGSYFRWNSFENAKIAKDYGFKSEQADLKTGSWHFADIDCHFISLHHFLKWYKFGFLRSFDHLSIEIRYGLINRSEAIEKLETIGFQQPVEDVKRFCHFANKNVHWFWDVAERFRNKTIWKLQAGEWKIPGFIAKNWNWSEK